MHLLHIVFVLFCFDLGLLTSIHCSCVYMTCAIKYQVLYCKKIIVIFVPRTTICVQTLLATCIQVDLSSTVSSNTSLGLLFSTLFLFFCLLQYIFLDFLFMDFSMLSPSFGLTTLATINRITTSEQCLALDHPTISTS